ncbi:peptidyl-prolyl cis-trans isomerase [Prevotella sp. A2931]|uniref:Peptidyl-prolyl cis-trans isomerase n=1 Tax=Prevotella illustrans TaxID=2800387 RepID=A0ABS3M6P3_9BACT|nr:MULTISPECIES: peptidylprolyl isomerase [Prevotella]MBO1363847.1 peptidyl-prolyl cis-trans isomerase [Prevotella illustrans]
MAFGQNDDPVVMRVNGRPVLRSEFFYCYRQGNVSNRLSLALYIDRFIDYRLKVEAAMAAHLDIQTATNDMEALRAHSSLADFEPEARQYYDTLRRRVEAKGGLVKPAQILIRLGQRAGKQTIAQARMKIDSLYSALRQGADFATMARRFSQDTLSAQNGGEMGWIERGTGLKEFEDVAFALHKGEMSRPFESPEGYHILLLKDKCGFLPYDTLKDELLSLVDLQHLRDKIKQMDGNARKSVAGISSPIIQQKDKEPISPETSRNLLAAKVNRESRMAYAITRREIGDRAVEDEAGLERFFQKNKKNYRWTQPRFYGVAYTAKDKKEIKAVRKALKGLDVTKWKEVIQSAFNRETEHPISAAVGLFRQGDNMIVDQLVFKTGIAPQQDDSYIAVYGKKHSAPKSLNEVRTLVQADYQEALEKEWVRSLRQKYQVEVYRDAIFQNENN